MATLLGSILSKATSLVWSTPTTLAATVVVCEPLPLKTTLTESAAWPLSVTTWALVRMKPSFETTNPEPSDCAEEEGTWPKKLWLAATW